MGRGGSQRRASGGRRCRLGFGITWAGEPLGSLWFLKQLERIGCPSNRYSGVAIQLHMNFTRCVWTILCIGPSEVLKFKSVTVCCARSGLTAHC